jgi:peptidyl-prolyl cis-trans isomerase C
VVAKVGDKVIRLLDVMERIQMLPPQLKQAPLEQIYPNVLQQMAMRIATVKIARDKGIEKTVEFKKAQQEMQLNLLQEMFLFGGLKESFTDKELQEEYDAYMKEFVSEDQVRARHILVKEEKEAQDLIEQIKSGEDFAKLAEKKSLDHLSAKRGGDLDFFGKNDLIPEFTKVAFEMKDGELLEKPVKTQFGFHVIKREGGRKKEAVPYEKAKASILPNRIRQREIQARMKEAMDTNKIELYNMDGSPLKMTEPGAAEAAGGAPASAAKPESSKAEEHSEAQEAESDSNEAAEALGEDVGEALNQ